MLPASAIKPIIDAALNGARLGACEAHRGSAGLRGLLSGHEGRHCSFGASVEEHLPEQCAQMLRSLHALVLAMQAWSTPILVAVRGQCLGGGLEFACAGGLLFAHRPGRSLANLTGQIRGVDECILCRKIDAVRRLPARRGNSRPDQHRHEHCDPPLHPKTPSHQAPSASLKIPSAASICAAFTTSGGIQRITLP